MVSRQSRSEPTLQVHVLGPEPGPLWGLDLNEAAARAGLTSAQCDQCSRLSKVVVSHGSRAVGAACFEHRDHEMCVHLLLTLPSGRHGASEILGRLLEALELACLASGGHRVLLLPEAIVTASSLGTFGYRELSRKRLRPWLEKAVG